MTKQDGDVRKMTMAGADIRKTMTMADGTAGHVTLNFDNNYSTNTFLSNGQIFSNNPWTATKNNFGTLVNNGSATLNGTLEVFVDDISPLELMVSQIHHIRLLLITINICIVQMHLMVRLESMV